jgi:hypothetical protein
LDLALYARSYASAAAESLIVGDNWLLQQQSEEKQGRAEQRAGVGHLAEDKEARVRGEVKMEEMKKPWRWKMGRSAGGCGIEEEVEKRRSGGVEV